MGMFNDFSRDTSREGWKYTYTGADLLPFARKKYEAYTKKELADRETLGNLMKDPSVSLKDERIEDLKGQIETNGNQREKCMVWVHEFTRKPETVYTLSLGDVTYFDIVTQDTMPKA